jgi:hypothetical protein
MGKKIKKSTIGSGIHAVAQTFRREMDQQAFTSMDNFDSLTVKQQKDAIRNALNDMGTNVAQNDAVPTGDGDQTLIESRRCRDIARELYAIGEDIHAYLISNSLSPFGMSCAVGAADAKVLKTKVEQQPYARNERFLALLNTRETSMRLSPLLLIVSAGKNLGRPTSHEKKHQEAAKLLLR